MKPLLLPRKTSASSILMAGLIAGLCFGCSGARLSHSEARKQIADIGTASLVPGSIQIQRIVSQSDKQAIAETTVSLAFEFEKARPSDPWRISSVRLGDQNWVGVDEIVSAVNESRRRATLDSMQKLAGGISAFRQRTGASPSATDIVSLTDMLHPLYMPDLIRNDAWGRPLHYEVSGTGYRLLSFGPDGVRGTPDDVLLAP